MNVSSVPEHRWLLPAALAAPRADGRWARRTTRDWATDALCFLVAAIWCLVAIGEQLEPGTSSWINAPASDAVLLADMAVGFLAAGALWGRRRWPVGVALAMVVIGSFSLGSAVAQLIALFTVAVHRRAAVATVMSVLCLGSSAIFCLLRPDPASSFGVDMAVSVGVILVVQLWGMVVRVRRQLVLSLRDRVHRAESEEQLRVAQARTLERTRIAREMHDVLAHRISLLSLHAGALEVRPDATPAEIGRAAAVIRASAHQALQDLREVIGVLRDQPGDPAPGRPQPILDDLPTLVDESRRAGVRVHLDLRVDEPSAVPDGIGRAAYRIVQEGLTNARKHAPGAAVSVTVGGAAGAGLSIAVRNPFPAGRSPDDTSPSVIPGTGTGLIGLAERATLVGGRLAPERTPTGEFALTAWLPWPT